ncbi:MAG: hypothetical protein EXR84_09895 [Gammaproteobacteria bacterium]|nr:hypothetical protein [Gammaproteobacteria bacterium]
MSKVKIAGIGAGVVVVGVILFWMFTAPYLPNYGIYRTPGILIGGTPTEAPADFTPLNGVHRGPILMQQAGFPPLVIYLSWVATPDGVITATRPDGGYWARRVRERGGDGKLRIGDATYTMTATEILGDQRLEMMSQWAAKSGRTLDQTTSEGAEPLRDWEVFFWTPR